MADADDARVRRTFIWKVNHVDLSSLRREYANQPLDVESANPCPFKQFESWFGEVTQGKILEPNAMVLATMGPGGSPTQRTVLLKYFDTSGFVFFTNYQSRKAGHIAENGSVSLSFPWYELQRQVEVNGVAEKVSTAESIKYFALRPRGSQLGAWVSEQSSVVSNRSILQTKLDEMKKKFAKGQVPMPSTWGGFRVVPTRFEFWQGGKNRLHDRIEYTQTPDRDAWDRQRLAP